jgi:hypothetical protein
MGPPWNSSTYMLELYFLHSAGVYEIRLRGTQQLLKTITFPPTVQCILLQCHGVCLQRAYILNVADLSSIRGRLASSRSQAIVYKVEGTFLAVFFS